MEKEFLSSRQRKHSADMRMFGGGIASYGRKEKETAKRSQMCVGPDDDDGVVYYKIY